MELTRKPFQGVYNIIRFNWHFYVGFAVVLFGVLLLIPVLPDTVQQLAFWGIAIASITVVASLLVSWWVYDHSDLYLMPWLKTMPQGRVLNINAGFDETSILIEQLHASYELEIGDFYDPLKHTEVSIERARKAYPQHPKTIHVSTSRLPFPDKHFGACVAMLSAHEIRNDAERIRFFEELRRVLTTNGKIYVTEHLRDMPNLLAYSLGVFHFYSRRTWQTTFLAAGLTLTDEVKTTPFVTTFILSHGIPD